MNQDKERDFENVKLRFIAESEAGQAPKLQDYNRRYPQFAGELTEFALQFTALENAAERISESPLASDATRNRIREIVAQTSAPAHNLADARVAMNWTLARFARELNVPQRAVVKLVRGLSAWPQQLEEKLAEVLGRSQTEARRMLENTRPIPATQFKASSQPQQSASAFPTWQNVLDECAQSGDLSDEQKREWLENAS